MDSTRATTLCTLIAYSYWLLFGHSIKMNIPTTSATHNYYS